MEKILLWMIAGFLSWIVWVFIWMNNNYDCIAFEYSSWVKTEKTLKQNSGKLL